MRITDNDLTPTLSGGEGEYKKQDFEKSSEL